MEAPAKPKLPDAYADLEVSPAASSAEIKAAFHRLALLHHPDKKAPGEAVDATDFRRIQEAYDTLRNSNDKTRYDQSYSSIRAQWDAYRKDHAEYVQDPNGWRHKKSAEQTRSQTEVDRRSAELRRQARSWTEAEYEFYEDSDDDDYGYGYRYSGGYGSTFGGGFAGFGHNGHGSRAREPEEWDPEEILLAELLRRRGNYEAAAKRSAEERSKKAAIEDINKRCVGRLKKAAKAQHAKSDGIRIVDPEKKRTMAQSWVESLQRDYDEELQKAGLYYSQDSVMDLGWERRKGRQTCLFCNAHVQEYSYRCPSGGAVACRGCKKKVESSSLTSPFDFYNTGSATTKGKGKKGKAGKKSKKTEDRAERDSGPEESQSADQEQDEEQDNEGETELPLKEEEEAAKQAAEKLARKQEAERQKQERKADAARQKAEREAQAKLAQEAAEKAAQEKAAKRKAEAEKAAHDRAAEQEAARQAAEEKKKARDQEAKEKKAARKKAAKERAAIEKTAQKKTADEMEAAQRETQEKHVPEQQAQKARDYVERTAREKSGKEAKEWMRHEAREDATQGAEECAAQELEKRAAQEAEQRAELEAKETVERVNKDAVERLEKELAGRNANEAVERQTQAYTKTDDVEGYKSEGEETNNGKPRVLLPRPTTVEHSINDNIAVPKKAKKKATRPLPTCYACKEQGHFLRNCPTKHTKTTKVYASPLHTATQPVLNVEVTSKPSPPTPAPAKVVVKLPAPRKPNMKEAANDTATVPRESTTPSANAAAPQKLAKPNGALKKKKKAMRPAPPKDQAINGVATSAPPLTDPTPVNGTADTPVPTQASKPVKKPRVKGPMTCYVCNESGHKAKSCPTKTREPMFEVVR